VRIPNPEERGGILPDSEGPGHAQRSEEAQRTLQLLARQPELLEPGLTMLDVDLRLDQELWLDLLLRDGEGRPVVALFCDAGLPAGLGRLAAVLAALVSGRWLLERLYGHNGLDAHQRPRFVLLSSRFADSEGPLLELLGGVDARLLEYTQASASDGTPQTLLTELGPADEPVACASSGAPAPAPGRGRGPAEAQLPPPSSHWPPPDAPPTASPSLVATLLAELELAPERQQQCRRLHESVTALSHSISVSRRGARLEFRVSDELLCSLEPSVEGLALGVGDQAFAVVDEASLHICLNAVFDQFFSRFAPRC